MTENHVGSKDASVVAPGRLVLLRHGQTVWSESGQHTGRTDIPLTDTGRLQAESAGERLRSAFPNGFDPGCMFASPLRRARQTPNGITVAPRGAHASRSARPAVSPGTYGGMVRVR